MGSRAGPAGTVGGMERVREAWERLIPHPVAVFSLVTLFIWLNRIWLSWTQKGVGVPAKLATSIPITFFVIAAGILLVAMWRGADRTSPGFRNLVRAFSAGTVAYWAIRGPMILAHHHPAGFKAVHAVLAVVSIAVAVLAWRSLGGVHVDGRPIVDEPASPNALV